MMLHQSAQGHTGKFVVATFFANPNGEDKAGGVISHHPVGDVDGTVDAIMAHAGTPNANVYLCPNLMRSSLERGKKGSESDVVAVLALVADMDEDTGRSGSMPVEPNYVVESSPGNYQCFILLDAPMQVREAKALASALKRGANADHCTADMAHVWRVPGTLNWPNAKKLARGRTPDPVAVTVAEPWQGELSAIADLERDLKPWAGEALRAIAVEVGSLPDLANVQISPVAQSMLAADDVGDRSGHAARVIEQLAYDGLTAEEACAAFLSAAGNWFARYEGKDPVADFTRIWGKFGAPHAEERAKPPAVNGLIAGYRAKTPPVPANDNKPTPLIISSAQLVSGFIPPDYFIDGVAQKGFIYSMTGATGTGKTAVLLLIARLAAEGGELAGRGIEKGRVVYFAGENPDDVTMRWIGMAHETGFDVYEIDVHFIRDRFNVPDALAAIHGQVDALGGADLIVVDTSAAFFQGTDENGNTELGKHARDLRMLTTLPGRPCVMVACHPTKNATSDNLLPRGGGAFIAEVDGNLTLAKSDGSVKLHWQGKHRGPDFDPITLELKTITAPGLVDSKGRPIPTVMAQALSAGDVKGLAAASRRDEDDVLLHIDRDAKASLVAIAESLGWKREDGSIHKDRARRATDKLRRDKLITYEGRRWKITPGGHDALIDIRAERHREQQTAEFVVGARSKMAVRARPWGAHDPDDD